MPSSITLDVLHSVIQGAMPWQDYHLHEFEIAKQLYEAREIDDDGWDRADERKEEKKFALGDLVKKGDSFNYTYDFGDGWRHLITVEKFRKDSRRTDLDCKPPPRAVWLLCCEIVYRVSFGRIRRYPPYSSFVGL